MRNESTVGYRGKCLESAKPVVFLLWKIKMLEIAFTVVLTLGALLALVLVNGVCVAAEFALVRVRRTRLEELAGQGREAAKHAILLVDHIGEYLAVTQIGITAASLGVGWLSESSVARALEAVLPAGRLPGAFVKVSATTAAFLVVTMILVILGELVPKNLAVRRAEELLLLLARPLQILHVALRPALRFLETLASWVLQFIGHGSASESPLTEEELKLVLMDSHEEGVVTASEAKIIVRALEFADKQAIDIMIPAERVDFISLARTLEENLEVAHRHMHARLPLCRDGLDSVVGVVSMKDVWPLLWSERSNAAFERASRDTTKIPLNLSQDQILRQFQEAHSQMGIVRNRDDRRTLGIVTLEDVLDSLLGDVREARPKDR